MAIEQLIAQGLTSTLGVAVLRRAKVSWLAYGAAAYVGLRLMRRYGVFADQADQALNLIDRGISQVISSKTGGRSSHQNAQRSYAH